MNFIKNIFSKKEQKINSYEDFWTWFQTQQKSFFDAVKKGNDIENNFFNKLSPKLNELKDGYYYLTGMLDDNTVELVLTADGNLSNIVFVEELIKAAPNINGWKFIALKPALDIENVGIRMNGYEFTAKNIHFYSNEDINYPDEIDISIVHENLNEENKNQIDIGVGIFLDNYLGELNFVNQIDSYNIVEKNAAKKELVPISKLKEFLIWREKEFIEKYEGISFNTEDDDYILLEATFENGEKLFAPMNKKLLNWDSKASHPWICILTFKYNNSIKGMPNDHDYKLLNIIEDEIMEKLKDYEGYLNVGRETAKGEREIYFACKDFRKPSKVFYEAQQKYQEHFDINYDIYKDKYWKSFNRFQPN